MTIDAQCFDWNLEDIHIDDRKNDVVHFHCRTDVFTTALPSRNKAFSYHELTFCYGDGTVRILPDESHFFLQISGPGTALGTAHCACFLGEIEECFRITELK
jgi:hypothetical protein